MTDETPQRDALPALGDPDDNGGDFAIEHRATTVDDDEDEAAGPATTGSATDDRRTLTALAKGAA